MGRKSWVLFSVREILRKALGEGGDRRGTRRGWRDVREGHVPDTRSLGIFSLGSEWLGTSGPRRLTTGDRVPDE